MRRRCDKMFADAGRRSEGGDAAAASVDEPEFDERRLRNDAPTRARSANTASILSSASAALNGLTM